MRNWPDPLGYDDWREWGSDVVRALSEDAAQLGAELPVGALVEMPDPPPAGWLKANGATFDTASYPQLAILLGGDTLPLVPAQLVPGGLIGPVAACVAIKAVL